MSSNMIKLPILFLSAAALGLPGDPRAPRTLKFSIPLTQKRLYVLLPEEDLSPLKDRAGRFLNYGYGDVDQAMNVKREAVSRMARQDDFVRPHAEVDRMARQVQEDQDNYKYAPVDRYDRFLVIDLAATNGMDMSSLSGLPLVQNPGLARMARQVQEDQDSYEYGPYAYGPVYGPLDAHAGPDHVDNGAYTGYGAFGWWSGSGSSSVLLGNVHRRRRQAPQQMAPVGRVKIQVYRGPSQGDYDFASWGWGSYNTQPADLAIHH